MAKPPDDKERAEPLRTCCGMRARTQILEMPSGVAAVRGGRSQGRRSPPGLELATQDASRACRGARWHFQNLPPDICPRSSTAFPICPPEIDSIRGSLLEPDASAVGETA